MPERYDVFISYARRDRPEWVQALATNLHQRGFDVFLDDWEMGPGDVVVHELDRGILDSKHGVLVITKSYFERPFVQAEYAAILHRAIEGRQRVIPVLVDDVEVPPLLAARIWIDFRGADGPEYERQLDALVRALRGRKARDRPPRTGEEVPPPATRYRPEGALRRTLRIGRERVALLSEDGEEGSHRPGAIDHALAERVYALGRARQRRFSAGEALPRRGAAEAVPAGAALQEACLAAGAALTGTFLAGAAGDALRKAVEKAESHNAALDLGLEIDEDDVLRALPWETLRIPGPAGAPGEPLALHPRVHLYRAALSDGATPAIAVPGPLRILAAIGSPETGPEGGGNELLDYERELAGILDAVEPARSAGRAHVRILHRGTVPAIREALEAERYHVLHLSCHAGPGVLILETDEGDADEVTAERLWREALPADRGVPLVVLAGCATALDVRRARTETAGEAETGEEALPGLAAELLARGVPTVLAMQASVSDAYATDLATRLYRALATQADPAPLAALARARRDAESARARLDPQDREFQLAEWATPALYLRGTPQLLYDPAAPAQAIKKPSKARFAPGVAVRKVGEFVGRRREERLVLKTLRGGRHAGALLRGIGGVGKSTLAAEVLNRLVAGGSVVASVAGETAPESILEAVGKAILRFARASKLPEGHAFRRTAIDARRPDLDWAERLDLLADDVLSELSVTLLLDNFEDNLAPPQEPGGDHAVKNQPLAEFLAAWLRSPGRSRLLVTSRYPFALPEEAHLHLETHHLGPLSFAETRKLFWRLEALSELKAGDQLRAYRAVGGHPRALEYLDALLRGGEAKYADVEIRLRKALKPTLEKEGVGKPEDWIRARVGADLDKALAETVTLAAADVLLEGLLDLLDANPLARRLLAGASVYRVPVDLVALAWQVGEEVEPEPDPEWGAIQKKIKEAVHAVRERGDTPTRENLGLSEREWRAYDEAVQRALRPPIEVPEGIAAALDLLGRLGLLSSIPAGDATLYQVHRWTASALEKETAPGAIQEAHRRAASFWHWRVAKMPQSREADVDQLLEARHHHHASGDVDQAVEVTEAICSQLDTWGAYGREEQLCREVLEWVPETSEKAADFLHVLGIVAQQRGSYEEALEWYRKSLAILEELGDRARMAISYHQLGMVAQQRGSYEEALEWYRKSLAIEEELGTRAGVANSYGQLGVVAQNQGSYEEALKWYRKALAIDEELGNRAGMASSYHQLGMVAEERGSYEEALEWYRKSLAIDEELGNRVGMAISYHQLGMVAQARGSYGEALEHYRKSVAIFEELGNLSEMASSLSQIGSLLTETGRSEEAVAWNLRSLAIRLEIGVPQVGINLHWLGRQREALGEARFGEILREHLDEDGAASVLRMLKESQEGE